MMKNIILTVILIIIFFGCEDSANNEFNAENPYVNGKSIYQNKCSSCHMEDGKGIEKVFPPLAASDFLKNNISKSIDIIINGYQGNMIVNSNDYNGIMPPQNLTNQEVVDVMNYILNSWGNNYGEISIKEVEAIRK